nr:amidase 1 [Quercus suber]
MVDSSLTPVVVLPPLHEIDLTRSVLQDMLIQAQQSDDVLTDEFCAQVVIQIPVKSSTSSYMSKISSLKMFRAIFRYEYGHAAVSASPAPYFVQGQNLHQAWRLYEDTVDAFVIPIIPEKLTQSSRFLPLNMLSSDGLTKLVAVPSRLLTAPSHEKPLAGKRLTIKDVLDMEGLQTTLASRDYVSIYRPATSTAEYVTELISLGAVIVGKSKTTQFATGDNWIDVHMPTNPRGDEYQFPDGSTTGGAVSLAAYPWLDASIGTDSGGSIRGVATCNGLFSLRTSFGTAPLTGYILILGAPDLVSVVCCASYADPPSKEFPKSILYPTDFFPHDNASQQAMIDEFVQTLERFLGVKHTRITLTDEWQKKPPEEAHGMSLEKFLDKNVFPPLCHDYYALYDDFRRDFRARFDSAATEGWERQRVVRDWFHENIMIPSYDTLSSAVMIMRYGDGGPQYRDMPDTAPRAPPDYGPKFMSSILETPQLMIPGRREYRPVLSSLMGAKGGFHHNDLLGHTPFYADGANRKRLDVDQACRRGAEGCLLANRGASTWRNGIDHDSMCILLLSDPLWQSYRRAAPQLKHSRGGINARAFCGLVLTTSGVTDLVILAKNGTLTIEDSTALNACALHRVKDIEDGNNRSESGLLWRLLATSTARYEPIGCRHRLLTHKTLRMCGPVSTTVRHKPQM